MSSLFAPTSRLELFRRLRGHVADHLQSLISDCASAKKIASVREDLAGIDEIIRLNEILPLDTPADVDEPPHVEQPLCPPGMEAEMDGYIDHLMEIEE